MIKKKSSLVRCKKNSFLYFKCRYLAIYVVEVFENSSTHSYKCSSSQVSKVTFEEKKYYSLP